MTIQDTTSSIGASAKRFFSGTLISRCSGMVREVAMAAVFGTSPAVAAFWMAFRFAHLLRRLFGEGALHTAFVPHFEALRKQDAALGAHFFYQLSTLIALVLLVITGCAEGVLASLLTLCSLKSSSQEVIQLTMVMLPALLFICLYALNCSLLHCERVYFLPSVAPTFLNIIWVGAIFLVYHLPETQAIHYLAMMIVLAFALQWLSTMPPVIRYLKDYRKKTKKQKWQSGEWIQILKPFSLGIIGVAATQINSALDSLFARAADPEGPAYLWYALRIQQLPLAIVGVALTGALLPPLSRAVHNGEDHQYQHFLNFALKKAVVLMIPLTAALFSLGFSGITLVYGHGEFSHKAIVETTQCLWAYGAAIFPMTVVLILAAAFYAHKNYRTPTLIALWTVLLNVALNACFVFYYDWGAISVAIATTLASFTNAAALACLLKKTHGISFSGLPILTLKTSFASLTANLVTTTLGARYLHDHTLPHLLSHPLSPFTRHIPTQLLTFTLLSLTFSATFLLTAYLLQLRAFFDFLPLPRKKSPQ